MSSLSQYSYNTTTKIKEYLESMDCEFLEVSEISKEEEAELKRSTKKVKENPTISQEGAFPTGSYKDRLVGENPGAFLNAFGLDKSSTVLGEIEEEEDEIIEDVQEVIDGIANVKLSKTTKVRIRSKWTHSLIIKIFGRSMGFHFLHSRITGLWKLARSLDCVDLGHDFFLI